MKFIRVLLAVILAISIIISFTACGEKDLVKIRLNEVTHSIFYAPQYVALNLGFFEEEGLSIELINGQGADKVMTAVLSNQADIGFSGPEAAIYVYNEGKEDHAVVFAQLTKRDGSFLVGRQPEPDFKWTNVKGKLIIAGRKGGVPEMTLEYVLKKHGVMPGVDVELDTSTQFALMAGAFTGGMGDYVALFEPVASTLEREGKGYIVASIGRDSGEIPYTAYYAKKSYIKKNPEIIQKFTNAIYRGQVWVDTHTPEEVAEALKDSFPDSDMDLLVTVVKRYKEQDTWCTDPIMKKESLDLLQEVMKTAGELEKEAPYEKLVDNSFAEKAIKNIKK
ncbi:MAG TPA: ABC transporter substrate-binding protein [Clostridiales bacterium]|nr:ABC transporter substrate-binding protein [Clostridiales bacterium]HPV00880.1 ABC transporter substrate-binding protein [Clostridiales bacterium]